MSSSRRASSAACQPNRMFSSGRAVANSQRMTSTPIRSAASSKSIALPQLLCIGRPSSPKSERVAEDRLERRLAAENRAHREHRVEPVAELAGEALGDEVGRDTTGPSTPGSSRKWSVENGTMPASSHGLPTSLIRSTGSPHVGQAIFTASTNGRCGVWPSNASQPSTARSLKLLPAADDLERAARLAVVDRQRQSPVALLADHPVVHVQEPVELPFVAEAGDPADLVDDLHDLVAEARVDLLLRQLGSGLVVDRAHADEPLVDEPEDERRAAAPAVRIAVDVGLEAVEASLALEVRRRSARRRRGRRGPSASRSRRRRCRSRRSGR